jgi:methenyltetrahydromethanopterin cyclohydrolase
MKKIKYYYNTNTLRYEKLETPLRVKLLRVLGFMAGSIVTAVLIVSIAFKYIDSPKEKILIQQYEAMRSSYDVLDEQTRKLQQQMTDLEKRDNEVYRVIFEASPIPDSARVKAMAKQKEIQLVQAMDQYDLSSSISGSLNNIAKRVSFQNKSFDEIEGFIKNKEKLLACTPAIQPLSNKELTRIASGFGYRIDPGV